MSHSIPQNMAEARALIPNIAPAAVLAVIGLMSLPTYAEPASTRSLCGADEETVFACRMHSSKKFVSLCATPASADGRRFYYVFGRPSSIELRYPSGEARNDAFSRTHLMFFGNTGGYAYAFTNVDHKYILYSISGARGYEQSGLIVQRDGSKRALQDMRCQASTLLETEDDLTRKTTYQWSPDPEIESTGLPSLR